MTSPSFEAFGGAEARPVWDALEKWRAAGRRFALITVVESRGFTPQKPGAHLLLGEDGEIIGTVGGGAIELEALEQARVLLREGGGHARVQRHLTRELGMCCGGEMAMFVEIVEPAERMFLFGAGYIAQPLAALAAGVGFDVTVIDERPEWATAERFPRATRQVGAAEDFARSLATTDRDYALVMTHDHAVDQRLVQHLLRKPLKFLGMIGSVPKQRKFALRLRARGFADAEIARLRTPLGLAIGARSPQEIAVSVMAELIAVRRGGAPDAGWIPPARVAAREPGAADPAASEELAVSSPGDERSRGQERDR